MGIRNVLRIARISVGGAVMAALLYGTFAGTASSISTRPFGHGEALASSLGANVPSYRLVAADGGVFAFGGSSFLGSMGGKPLDKPVVGMAPGPSGTGYWLVASDGGVFSFGGAQFYGSLGGRSLPAPIVGMAADPLGGGYWLVSSAGTVYAFGQAPSLGSLLLPPASPIVGIAAAPDGLGYWLAASNGAVYPFGTALSYGSLAGVHLNKPVVGIASTPDGRGYWLVAADGGVFTFGDAGFFGSLGGSPPAEPVVGMAPTPDAKGYWLTTANGGVSSFGDAGYFGSVIWSLVEPVVGITEAPGNGDPTVSGSYPSGATGYDISFPQCSGNGAYVPPRSEIAIVGVNGGRAFTPNPCLASELSWASNSPGVVYVNINAPGSDSHDMSGPAGNCSAANFGCQAINYGFNALDWAIAYANGQASQASTPAPKAVWLDVENVGGCSGSTLPSNGYWTCSTALNADVISGAIDAIATAGLAGGIYSTAYQWQEIAGDYSPGLPLWVPAAGVSHSTVCSDSSYWFGGGKATITQGESGNFDTDEAC